MTDDYGPRPDTAPPPRPTFLNRFWMIVVQPEVLFRWLGRNPAWFPMALLVAAGLAAIVLSTPAEMWEEQLRSGGQPVDDASVTAIKIVASVAALVAWLIIPVVVAGVTSLIFIFMRGDDATYRQHLSVVSHVGIVYLIGAVVHIPLQRASGNFREALSVGTFFPFLPEGFLLAFLNQLHLFGLWGVFVMGIGLAALDPRRRAGPTIAVLLVLQLILSLTCAWVATSFSPAF